MKETGILRRIDELGRIVIPKEIRRKLKIREGDNMDIFVNDDTVILKKYSLMKDLEMILEILLTSINATMIITNLENVIASNHSDIKTGDELDEGIIKKILTKEVIHINKNYPFKITSEGVVNFNLVIKPIIIFGDIFGAIILLSDFDISNVKMEMLDLVHSFCTEYLQT